MTLTEFAKISRVPRSTLSSLSSGKDVNISVRTLEKIVSAGFFEIRRVLADRDRLSDSRLREQVFNELIAPGPVLLSTKRQENELNKAKIEQFFALNLPEEEVNDD